MFTALASAAESPNLILLLSQKDFENYLSASVNAGSERSGLYNLTQTLKGDKRALFLEASANGGTDTKALIQQVSKMGKTSAALGDFLNAASRTKDLPAVYSLRWPKVQAVSWATLLKAIPFYGMASIAPNLLEPFPGEFLVFWKMPLHWAPFLEVM